ncbi:hypothetical protein O181_052649 [Austropuccinia psidii MF-1]|uniref:Uncharacterized protein n=1 Tax=Austropuccinia psidii MF-1 TaxID=1389203 RepID=A0A9Q3HRW7_9BASI|nr:hypothetical protein [Austropuccinia psidii MF-1]
MSSSSWQIGPYWCFIAFGPHHLSLAIYGSRPYPALFRLFDQLPISPIPLVLGLGVPSALQEPLDPLATTRARGPTPLIRGGPFPARLQQWPLAVTFIMGFPSRSGKPPTSTQLDSLCRTQEWCIYGIICHYAPFFLSNQMVMFSGPNYVIPTPVLKSITHFEGRLLSHSVLQSLAATRRPFEDPNHLALQEFACTFFQDSSKGNFKRLSSIQSVFKASSTSVFLGQLNCSIQVVFKKAVWPWPFWANSYSTVGI